MGCHSSCASRWGAQLMHTRVWGGVGCGVVWGGGVGVGWGEGGVVWCMVWCGVVCGVVCAGGGGALVTE